MAPRKVGTKKDTKRTLRHVRPVFYGIFTRKILGNASSIGKNMQTGVGAVEGDASMQKKFVPFGRVKKK